MTGESGSTTVAGLILRLEVAGMVAGIVTGTGTATATRAAGKTRLFPAPLMTCIATTARRTPGAAACSFSSSVVTLPADRATAGATTVAESGWIAAAGPTSRLSGKSLKENIKGDLLVALSSLSVRRTLLPAAVRLGLLSVFSSVMG